MTLVAMNLIEEFVFQIGITIDNEMDDGSYSFVQTDDIVLTVSCSSVEEIAIIPSFDEAIELGEEAQFVFEPSTCEPSDCC